MQNKLVIGFAVVCVLALGSLTVAVFFASTMNGKDSEIANLRNQINDKNTLIANWQLQLSPLNSQIASLQSSLNGNLSLISDLSDQLSNLTAPYLVWSPFEVNTNGGFFMVSGFICNTGTDSAYNVKLHIVAYAVDGTKVIDGYSPNNLGNIEGRQIVSISNGRDIYYGGGILSNWTITPEWSSTP